MTESIAFSEIQPGETVAFNNFAELSRFENFIADSIHPDLTPDEAIDWNARPIFRELVTPKGYHGTMRNIRATMMDDPYARFKDCWKRGWSLANNKAAHQYSDRLEVQKSFRGFQFSAEATSTGRGVIGQILAEAWYMATPYTANTYSDANGRSVTVRNPYNKSYGHIALRRIVTTPQYAVGAFTGLTATSVQIGFALLQHNMRNPILQPMSE